MIAIDTESDEYKREAAHFLEDAERLQRAFEDLAAIAQEDRARRAAQKDLDQKPDP